MPNTPPNLIAGGNIVPCSFVKISGELTCVQSGANEVTVGVVQEGTNYPPLSDLSITAYAAQSGQTVRLFGAGDVCLLQLGGTVTAGDFLKSDASGYGVVVSSGTGQNTGARALQSGVSGEKILVEVLTNRAAT